MTGDEIAQRSFCLLDAGGPRAAGVDDMNASVRAGPDGWTLELSGTLLAAPKPMDGVSDVQRVDFQSEPLPADVAMALWHDAPEVVSGGLGRYGVPAVSRGTFGEGFREAAPDAPEPRRDALASAAGSACAAQLAYRHAYRPEGVDRALHEGDLRRLERVADGALGKLETAMRAEATAAPDPVAEAYERARDCGALPEGMDLESFRDALSEAGVRRRAGAGASDGPEAEAAPAPAPFR